MGSLCPAGPGVLPGGEQPAVRVRDRALLRGERLLLRAAGAGAAEREEPARGRRGL